MLHTDADRVGEHGLLVGIAKGSNARAKGCTGLLNAVCRLVGKPGVVVCLGSGQVDRAKVPVLVPVVVVPVPVCVVVVPVPVCVVVVVLLMRSIMVSVPIGTSGLQCGDGRRHLSSVLHRGAARQA